MGSFFWLTPTICFYLVFFLWMFSPSSNLDIIYLIAPISSLSNPFFRLIMLQSSSTSIFEMEVAFRTTDFGSSLYDSACSWSFNSEFRLLHASAHSNLIGFPLTAKSSRKMATSYLTMLYKYTPLSRFRTSDMSCSMHYISGVLG